MKKIILAGGSGFIGKALHTHLKSKGYQLIVLTRSPKHPDDVLWDGKTLGDWTAHIEGAFALINLAGKSINCRHTEENKKAILATRLETTQVLGNAIAAATHPPQVWMNASAAGIYPHDATQPLSEYDLQYGTDFVAEVAIAWEKTFHEINTPHTRKIALRTTLVFGDDGGAFIPLKKLSQVGLGGKQGSGKQKVSWIHRKDYVKALSFLLEHEELSGPINLCAPQPTDNQTLMAALRKAVKMPIGIPQPAWLLRIGAQLIGTPPELILHGMNVIPTRLVEANFTYEFPSLALAFDDLVR
ncbi:TIGR01777 family oxidoreductase [Flavobacteriaceae bacterium F08102]|nr:TIGR01777 family oxidoreductase [Flavobacteriaceae bacterium F08102]